MATAPALFKKVLNSKKVRIIVEPSGAYVFVFDYFGIYRLPRESVQAHMPLLSNVDGDSWYASPDGFEQRDSPETLAAYWEVFGALDFEPLTITSVGAFTEEQRSSDGRAFVTDDARVVWLSDLFYTATVRFFDCEPRDKRISARYAVWQKATGDAEYPVIKTPVVSISIDGEPVALIAIRQHSTEDTHFATLAIDQERVPA